MKITMTLALLAMTLSGCGQDYRYPCQNPDNWNQPQCQLPQCQVERSCPEHIFDKESLDRMKNAVNKEKKA